MTGKKQVVVTVASGPPAGKLDKTFSSFQQNPFLELHAFIVDYKLPENRVPGITYHLKEPDPAFSHPMRDMYYRRWSFIDELDADYALVVDNGDVLCLQPLPELPALLRGAALGACVEHDGGRYLSGQQYVSCYLNAGVTLWDVPASRPIRRQILERGRTRYRNIDDQLSLNEVVHALFYDQLVILPSQYNYRAYLGRRRRGTPTVQSLDGVVLYHNSYCIEQAKALLPVARRAALPALEPDLRPLTLREQFWRRVQQRREPHFMRNNFLGNVVDIRSGGLWTWFKSFMGWTRSK